MWALYQNNKLLGGDKPIIRATKEKIEWELQFYAEQGFEGLATIEVEIVPC